MENYNLEVTVQVNNEVKEYISNSSVISSIDGKTFNAKDILCVLIPLLRKGLEALKLISNQFWVKLAISIIERALGTFSSTVCESKI